MIEKHPPVIVVAPVADAKNYILPLWLAHIQNLSYPNFEIFLVDNSKTKDNYYWLKSIGIPCTYMNPGNRRNIDLLASCQNAAKAHCLKKKAHMMSIECDIFPPLSIIQLLMQHRKPVVSAIYHINDAWRRHLCMQEPVYNHATKIKYHFNLDKGTDLIELDGTLKMGWPSGIGCVLIKHQVLKKFTFRTVPGLIYSSDSWLYKDLESNNIPFYTDTSILCEHYNRTWTRL